MSLPVKWFRHFGTLITDLEDSELLALVTLDVGSDDFVQVRPIHFLVPLHFHQDSELGKGRREQGQELVQEPGMSSLR